MLPPESTFFNCSTYLFKCQYWLKGLNLLVFTYRRQGSEHANIEVSSRPVPLEVGC